MLHNYGCKNRTYYQDKQANEGLFALFLLIFLNFVQESRQKPPLSFLGGNVADLAPDMADCFLIGCWEHCYFLFGKSKIFRSHARTRITTYST